MEGGHNNNKNLQYIYSEYFLESRMMGNYHVRFGKGVNYMFDTKQFTLVHYNSIITAHAILMIFFMVEKMQMLKLFLVFSQKIYYAVIKGSLVVGDRTDVKHFSQSRKLNLTDNLNKLNPNWITGIIDAEGCFHISVISQGKQKWSVRPVFQIGLMGCNIQKATGLFPLRV